MNTLKRTIKPSDLQADLESAEQSQDIRMFVLYANLYNEHFVSALHESFFKNKKYKKCKVCQRFLIPKFNQQVKDLAEVGVIPKEHGHDNVIILINEFRNELAHNLTCTSEELEKKYEERATPIFVDPTGLIQEFLKNCTTWEKVKLSVFASVTSLYHQYEKINGRIPEETIHYTMNSEGTAGGIVIKPYINKDIKSS